MKVVFQGMSILWTVLGVCFWWFSDSIAPGIVPALLCYILALLVQIHASILEDK